MLPAIQHCLEGLYELDYFTGESNAALAAGEPVKVSETEYESLCAKAPRSPTARP